MSRALLHEAVRRTDRSVIHLVEVDPADLCPFRGPPGQTWAGLHIKEDGLAEFTFRCAADDVIEIAEDVAAGRMTVPQALRRPAFAGYVEARLGSWPEGEVRPRGHDTRHSTQVKRFAVSIASGDVDLWRPGGLGVYGQDDDRFLVEAAEALGPDLPAWARVGRLVGGGPGTGFTAGTIVTEAGHSLAELVQALNLARRRHGG